MLTERTASRNVFVLFYLFCLLIFIKQKQGRLRTILSPSRTVLHGNYPDGGFTCHEYTISTFIQYISHPFEIQQMWEDGLDSTVFKYEPRF